MDITSFVLSHRDRAFLIGDHGNYRALLSGQLATLRRRLGIATPKNAKYSAKPITASDVRSNVEFAHILLLTAERAWAHAMQMKTAHSEDGGSQKFPGSARSHIVSRFTKATKTARILVELVRENLGSGTTTDDVAEAEAYAAYMAGLAELDKHSPSMSKTEGSGVAESWRKCLQNLAVAKVIYGALWKSARKDCFKDILSSAVDPTIRFAAYRSNIPRTVAIGEVARRCFPRDEQDLVSTVEDIDKDALDSEEGMPMGGLPSTISWRSRKANIVDASIGQALVSVATAEQQLASLVSDGWEDLSAEARAAAYDEVLNACQDTVDATRHAIEDHEKEKIPEGDRRMQDLRVTHLAVNYDLIGWRVGRNRVLIGEQDGISTEELSVKTRKRSRSQSVDKAESRSKRLARLQDRVVLYDAILQSIESVKELRGAARDMEFMEELEAKKNYFHALKCLNIAYSHIIMSNLKNALALFIRAETLGRTALSAASPSSPIKKSAPLKLDIHPDFTKALHTKLEHVVLQYRALVQLQGLAGVKGESPGSSNPLVEHLDEYPAGGVDLSNLVTYPPKLRPVPVKPLFFDLAWNYIQYPGQEAWSANAKPGKSIDKEEKKPAKRGWFGFG